MVALAPRPDSELVPSPGAVLQWRCRRLERKGQSDHQTGVWVPHLRGTGSRFVSRTWRPARTKTHPQILLTRPTSVRLAAMLSTTTALILSEQPGPLHPAGQLRLNGGTMKLIPHHQEDKHGPREYRSPDGTWRILRTRRPGVRRNDRPRWEVHERHEGRADGWRHHAAFERWRDALVFLGTTAVVPGNESVTTAPPKRRETPDPRRNRPSPVRAGRRRARSRTTSTKPGPRVSRGRRAACSCTIRGRPRRAASRRPAGSASGSDRRPAIGNARQRRRRRRRRRPDRPPFECACRGRSGAEPAMDDDGEDGAPSTGLRPAR